MRTFTTKHTVYNFDELSDEGKEKALENLRDINVEMDFWVYDDFMLDLAEQYGIKLNLRDMCFDLYHREFYLDLHDHGRTGDTPSYIEDERVFLKRAGIKLNSKDGRALIANGIGLDTQHYGGGSGATKINVDRYDSEVSAETEEKLQETIQEFEAEALATLQQEYDYRTSDEAVIDTINANEYEFYADGKLA